MYKYGLEIVENDELIDGSDEYFSSKKKLIEYCESYCLEANQECYVTRGYDGDTVYYDEELTNKVNRKRNKYNI